MRELFDAFLKKTPEDFEELWTQCEFTFDANVLLDLYSAKASLVEEIFAVWSALEDRIFLTHQAGLEFYRNRPEVILRARGAYESICKLAEDFPSAFSSAATEKLRELLTEEKEALGKFLEDDNIEARINKTFEGKVTDPLDDSQQAYAAIESRYAARIPPGFADAGKGDYHKYGDAIMWFLILRRARSTKKPVIFITSEKKPDWWERSNDNKIVGPRPELALEMRAQANVSFHMYSVDQFINHAKKFLKLSDALTDAKTSEAVAEVDAIRSSGNVRYPLTMPPSGRPLMSDSFAPYGSAWRPDSSVSTFWPSSNSYPGMVDPYDYYRHQRGWNEERAADLLESALRNGFGFPLTNERAAIAEALDLLRPDRRGPFLASTFNPILFYPPEPAVPVKAKPAEDEKQASTDESAQQSGAKDQQSEE